MVSKIQKLKEARSHLVLTCEDIVKAAAKEDRDLTDEEIETTDKMLAEARTHEAQIQQIEKAEAARVKILADVEEMKTPEKRVTNPVVPNTDLSVIDRRPVIETGFRYSKLRAFKSEEDAYKMGKWVRAALFGDQLCRRWCIDNGIASRALSEGTNTAGGNLVPTEMERAIIDLREEYGVFRRVMNITPMSSDMIEIPRHTSGITAEFIGEAATISESDPAWGLVTLVAKKMAIRTRYSSELAEDAIINISDTLAAELAISFALKEDQTGFTGDGTASFGSIFGVQTKINDGNHAASIAAALAGHNLYTEIDAPDIAKAMAILPEFANVNAKFYCSKVVKELVFNRLKATAGGNTITDLAGRIVDTYLGHEIVTSQVLNATTTDQANEIVFLFGDLSMAAKFGQRRGIQIAVSDQIHWATDQIAIRAIQRIDINVHDLGDATTAGPVVALQATT